MSKLLALEEIDHESDQVTFLVDLTRQRYVRLPSVNPANVVACVHAFLCKYDVFGEESKVVRKDRIRDYQPTGCSDYSCVMQFYQLIIRSYQKLSVVKKEPFVTVDQLETARQALKEVPLPSAVAIGVDVVDVNSSTDEDDEESSEDVPVSVKAEVSSEEEDDEDSLTLSAESITESESEPEPTPPPKRKSKVTIKSKAKPQPKTAPAKKTKTVQVKPKTTKKSRR